MSVFDEFKDAIKTDADHTLYANGIRLSPARLATFTEDGIASMFTAVITVDAQQMHEDHGHMINIGDIHIAADAFSLGGLVMFLIGFAHITDTHGHPEFAEAFVRGFAEAVLFANAQEPGTGRAAASWLFTSVGDCLAAQVAAAEAETAADGPQTPGVGE